MGKSFLENLIEEVLNRIKDVSLAQKQEIVGFKDKSVDGLSDYLVGKKLLDEEQLTEIKASAWNLPYKNLFAIKIPEEVFETLSLDVVENYKMVPFEKSESILNVGLVNPENYQAIEALDFLGKKFGLDIQVFVISKSSYDNVIQTYKTLGEEVDDVMDVAEEKFQSRFKQAPQNQGESQELESVLQEAPITKIISVIIKHAVEGHASDIHIEPLGQKTRIRYRIDGILRTTLQLPKYIHSALIARVKVMANMKLDETRIPQDGRIRVDVEGRDIDFRVSTLPLVENEKVVMRVLQNTSQVPTLEDLGFNMNFIEIINKNIKRPHGIFLATGPTGSGKSTTLYSVLNLLNKEGVNIVTLEDPVEYYINGVNQSQVKSDVKYNFASGLRSILRQDPNIIMVGEIRDIETAKMAVNAGLTGHLLFSTIHTNNAIGAIPRLIDMGVEPFLIASTLNLVIAQRLTRKLCEECRIPQRLPNDLAEQLTAELHKLPPGIHKNYKKIITKFEFFAAKGCSFCGNTGYRGRIGIAEILQITETLQKIIYNGFDLKEVDDEVARQEMVTLKQDGILRALEGITSLEEVLRVTEE